MVVMTLDIGPTAMDSLELPILYHIYCYQAPNGSRGTYSRPPYFIILLFSPLVFFKSS